MTNANSFLHKKDCENWYNIILKSRHQYKCSRIHEIQNLQDVSIKEILKWIYIDIIYVITQCKEIFVEIKLYGALIHQQYNVTVIRQFFQQAYLVLVLRVPVYHYRVYLLFKPDRWKYVKEFTYENYQVQMVLVKYSFPKEKDLFDNKLKFFNHCLANNISTPSPIAIFKNGKEILAENTNLQLPTEDIFVKDLFGKGGQGAAKYRFGEGIYRSKGGSSFTSGELIQLLRRESRTNRGIIVQKAFKNHAEWHKFTSGALSTCRIVTALSPKDGEVFTLGATMRLPVGNSDIDNISTGGGLACPVNLKTGVLGSAISFVPYNGYFEFDVHPDTGEKLAGTQLYCWNNILEFTRRAHSLFKTIFVGWDIALTTQGILLIEGNIGWGGQAIESPQQCPLLKTQYPELYDAWLQKFLPHE